MKDIDYDWLKIMSMLVDRFGISIVSEECEISIVNIKKILKGTTLEPCYSSGCLIIQSFKYYFPKKIKSVTL